MRFLDISYPEPEKNLALDEVMLESVEDGRAPDTFRLWESPTSFVVIGSGQRYRQVVNHFNCLRDSIPIMRRCSAGGAVLQGKGCLNFALALRYDSCPEVADLHGSYEFILSKVIAALDKAGVAAQRAGISDLVVEGLKVSGNAQRRRRYSCLHHGTLVYEAKYPMMSRYLLEPEDRPDYRGQRTHSEFVGVLPLKPEILRSTLREMFAPGINAAMPTPDEEESATTLMLTKYNSKDWTFRR